MAGINFFKARFAAGCLIFLGPAAVAGQTPPCAGIHVTILNIRNSTGTVDCALFDSPNGFPVDVLRSAMRLVAMKVPDTRARCDFESIPPRTYALVVLHDENMNGKLDTSRERVGNRHGSHVRSLPVCRLRLPQGRTGTSATWNTPMPERVLFRL
jgi:uncharacterized protein (DUF2141 family)